MQNVVMMEGHSSYSMILNLFDTTPKDIFVDINHNKSELAIYVGKKSRQKKSASFWVFGIPRDGILEYLKLDYKGGALQLTVPRLRPISAWAA